ncbi:MAG TPA: methyltransferase [Planctomycetota bacterium]|nr:methyltransferase [Planctomycetota bacterium]
MHATTRIGLADTHVHRLYSDFAGLPVGVVTQCVQHHATFNQVSWQECPGATFAEKAATYYEEHEECLFDLLHSSSGRASRRAGYVKDGHWSCFTGGGPTVLDFGGGLGQTASLLHEDGKHVTYCDVDGPTARFAAWFFERCHQNEIEVLLTSSHRVELPARRQWDLVLAEAVLECVPDPVGTAECLAKVVAPGGLLYLIADRPEAVASRPMRRPIAVADLLAGAPSLRAMEQVRSDDGCDVFRAS